MYLLEAMLQMDLDTELQTAPGALFYGMNHREFQRERILDQT